MLRMVATRPSAGQRHATGRPPVARNDRGAVPDAAVPATVGRHCRVTPLVGTLGSPVNCLSIRREMRRATS